MPANRPPSRVGTPVLTSIEQQLADLRVMVNGLITMNTHQTEEIKKIQARQTKLEGEMASNWNGSLGWLKEIHAALKK